MTLSKVLAVNGLFSAGASLLMGEALSQHIPLPEEIWLSITVGLGVFGIQLGLMSISPSLQSKLTSSVIISDLAWIILTMGGILIYSDHITEIGLYVILFVNLIVGLLAYVQWVSYGVEKSQLENRLSSFESRAVVNASAADVWAVLMDYGNIFKWNPGVNHSRLLTEGEIDVGSLRRCDIGSNYLNEEIIDLEVMKKITISVTETDMPFQKVLIHFELIPINNLSTQVIVKPEYSLKYGWIGELLDSLFINKQYKKGMYGLLEGLKQHAESP